MPCRHTLHFLSISSVSREIPLFISTNNIYNFFITDNHHTMTVACNALGQLVGISRHASIHNGREIHILVFKIYKSFSVC